jgi:hypothetical protein
VIRWLQKYGVAGLILALVLASKVSWHLARVALRFWIRWS